MVCWIEPGVFVTTEVDWGWMRVAEGSEHRQQAGEVVSVGVPVLLVLAVSCNAFIAPDSVSCIVPAATACHLSLLTTEMALTHETWPSTERSTGRYASSGEAITRHGTGKARGTQKEGTAWACMYGWRPVRLSVFLSDGCKCMYIVRSTFSA